MRLFRFCVFQLLLSCIVLNLSAGVVSISDTVDLENRTFIVPPNTILDFNGGTISNGTLVGNNTKIIGDISFAQVEIKGSWDIPIIRSSYFKDCASLNQLKNVFALTSDSIQNRVIIDSGQYFVSVTKDKISAIDIKSNTDVVINGTIQLLPTDLERYYVVFIDRCRNVTLSGSGLVCGDLQRHKGITGEWGMGVYINRSTDVIVRDIHIQNCWGDCVTIGRNSSNINIINCDLSFARRQGISICGGENILVDNCRIRGIRGTTPEYGIDIEPDANYNVSNVILSNILISDCNGGIMGYGGNGAVKNVIIENCSISTTRHQPINIFKLENVNVKYNTITNFGCSCIYVRNSTDVFICNNTINIGRSNKGFNIDSHNKRLIERSNTVVKNE